ncbi:3080_t:CDS:10 [Diversispora eburnea]|uniref:Dymeclin n=1 Tax=Diversispora eburnea TaxID=1213867 RepID=A0A9N8VIW6_9GLOM|nr:3080_t:CDS:10 [Diversispora eburnea]
MSNNYQQSAQLSRPPQLYSPPSTVPSLALPVSTDHSPISLSSYPTTNTNTASNRSFQGRKIPQLDTTALTLDRVVEQHHFLQSNLNSSSSSISNYFNNQTLSPNYLIFPNTPNTSASTPCTPVLGSHQQSIIERTSLTEIIIFTQNQYNLLKLLCSDRPSSINNLEYWENMLLNEKFPSTNSGQDAYDVEMATVSLAIEFATNNDKTANFNTLLLHALSQMNQVLDPEFTGEIPEAAYNSLFLVRIFSKHFIGNMTHDEIHRQFEGPITSILGSSPNGNNENKTRSLSLSSSSSSSGEERKEHKEHEEPKESEEPKEPEEPKGGVYKLNPDKLVIDPKVILDSRPKAIQLLDGLLNIILKIDPMYECLNTILVLFSTQIHQPSSNKIGNDYFLNIFLNQFSHLNNKLTLQLMTNFVEQRPPPSSSSTERSLLILLLLAAQWKIPGQKYNKFREGIKSLKDSQASEDFEMAISFRSLYQLICRQLPNEEICLMLYLLMVENEDFRVYILSRLDPEILTINYQPWFTERLLRSISLGGLTYLVLIRIIQFNLSSHRVTTLANLGNSIQDIHPYVAQRLVNLFNIVAKRYQKLVKKEQNEEDEVKSDDVAIYADLVCLVISESNLKSPSAEEVTELIETAARTWPPEESDSQEFFCPYVWALLYRHTWIYWDEDKVRILHNYIMYEEIEANEME